MSQGRPLNKPQLSDSVHLQSLCFDPDMSGISSYLVCVYVCQISIEPALCVCVR